MRVDVEVGYTLIEVKKDLCVGRVLADAEAQLAGLRPHAHSAGCSAARGGSWQGTRIDVLPQAGELASTGIVACGVS